MGLTANRLGCPDAAEELLRSGWAYANVIDHNALRGMLRARLSYVMYWRGRYLDSRDLAADGLRYASQGLVGANLHLEQARALARLGEPDAARQEVGLAHTAWEDQNRDDLAEIGGEEFALSQAATYSTAGSALAETGHGREAAGELERAIILYDERPRPGEHHGVAGQALARTRCQGGKWRRHSQPGAGSRTVADGTLPPAAGRRTGLASRPGPQASTRTSPRQVKSAPPQAGTGLTPGPEPRVDTARCPSRRNKGTAPGTGRPWAGHREGGTVACAAWARATVAPASSAGGQPGEAHACLSAARCRCREGVSWAGLAPRAAALSATSEIGFSGRFFTCRWKIAFGAAGALRMFGRVPAAHPLQAGAFTARSRRSLPNWPPSSEAARYSVPIGKSGSVPASPRTRRTSDPSSVPAIGTAG